MADLAERILAELQASSAALDDDQLAGRLGFTRRAGNRASRRLASARLALRRRAERESAKRMRAYC